MDCNRSIHFLVFIPAHPSNATLARAPPVNDPLLREEFIIVKEPKLTRPRIIKPALIPVRKRGSLKVAMMSS